MASRRKDQVDWVVFQDGPARAGSGREPVLDYRGQPAGVELAVPDGYDTVIYRRVDVRQRAGYPGKVGVYRLRDAS